MCSPKNSQQHNTFIPYVLPKLLPFLTYVGEPREMCSISKRNLDFGKPPKFQFFSCDGPIKIAHCEKRKRELGKHPPLPLSDEMKNEYTPIVALVLAFDHSSQRV
jgi:hypothetical protein